MFDQRRHQRLIEESPLPHEWNAAGDGKVAVKACQQVGTARRDDGSSWMKRKLLLLWNDTRIQGEHPVTEMVPVSVLWRRRSESPRVSH